MQLTFKYYGELTAYFPDSSEENLKHIDVDADDSIYSVIDQFNIPHDKINLILVNGIKVDKENCEIYRFDDGDVLAVWPINAKE